MTLVYMGFGLIATLVYGRVLLRRLRRFRGRRDSRARRELVTALAFFPVAAGLLVLTLGGWLHWPLNLRIVLSGMTAGAFVAAGFFFDMEDANDG